MNSSYTFRHDVNSPRSKFFPILLPETLIHFSKKKREMTSIFCHILKMKSTMMKNANSVIVFLREKRAYNMNSIVGDCCGHIYFF